MWWFFFFFQAEDGIRDLVRSRGLGDVYKRQAEADGHDDRLARPAGHLRAGVLPLESVVLPEVPGARPGLPLSLIHISEPTRPY